jgi:hypothetical protein
LTTWSVNSETIGFYVNFFVKPGDTLSLAPGSYSDLGFSKDLAFAGVTITSADPSHPAVLSHFGLSNVSGLTFSNLVLDATGPMGVWQFNIANSSDIHFDHVSVHGSLDGDPTNDANGILFTNAANISVTNSEFQQLGRASLAVLQGSNIQISGNNVHDIRTDGFEFAQVDHVTISGNTFANFHPVAGDHSDAMQLWAANTTAPSHDITISGNVIVVDDGASMQGIFLKTQSNLLVSNVTISNNLLYGTSFNGISVNYGDNVTITGNELLSIPGKGNETRYIISNSDHVTMADNDGLRYVFDHTTNITESHDTINPGSTDLGVAAMQAFAVLHPETAPLLAPFISAVPTGPSDPVPTPLLPSAPAAPQVPTVPMMPDPTFVPGMPMFGPGEFFL